MEFVNIRAKKILSSCNIDGNGLEIGASHNPIAPKKLGYNIEVLDHLSADGLRNKYKSDPNVNIENIEEVDYVWTGLPLDETTGKEEYYDYIIASHVIEHTPDLVSFLQQCSKMLKNNGILALAVPDRRCCFDYFRPNSSTGEIIQAYLDKRKTHTPGVIFDHFSNHVKKGGVGSWGRDNKEIIKLTSSLQLAYQMMQKAINEGGYIDAHNWRFTPASFNLVLHDLQQLNFIDLVVESSNGEESRCEFIISLKKGGEVKQIDRLDLLQEIVNADNTEK